MGMEISLKSLKDRQMTLKKKQPISLFQVYGDQGFQTNVFDFFYVCVKFVNNGFLQSTGKPPYAKSQIDLRYFAFWIDYMSFNQEVVLQVRAHMHRI